MNTWAILIVEAMVITYAVMGIWIVISNLVGRRKK